MEETKRTHMEWETVEIRDLPERLDEIVKRIREEHISFRLTLDGELKYVLYSPDQETDVMVGEAGKQLLLRYLDLFDARSVDTAVMVRRFFAFCANPATTELAANALEELDGIVAETESK